MPSGYPNRVPTQDSHLQTGLALPERLRLPMVPLCGTDTVPTWPKGILNPLPPWNAPHLLCLPGSSPSSGPQPSSHAFLSRLHLFTNPIPPPAPLTFNLLEEPQPLNPPSHVDRQQLVGRHGRPKPWETEQSPVTGDPERLLNGFHVLLTGILKIHRPIVTLRHNLTLIKPYVIILPPYVSPLFPTSVIIVRTRPHLNLYGTSKQPRNLSGNGYRLGEEHLFSPSYETAMVAVYLGPGQLTSLTKKPTTQLVISQPPERWTVRCPD